MPLLHVAIVPALIVALYKYFKKGGPVLPTLRTCGVSSLSGKDIQLANMEVLGESSGEPTRKKAVTPVTVHRR